MNDSLLPSRPLRALSALASSLWWLLVTFWLALALAWGALHGWIVPRIGELRPQLETQATRVLGMPVRIGSVTAHSDSLMPSFELRDVVLHDAQAREALRLARVVVTLSPRSLWNLDFEQLYIERPQLDVRRSADGRLWVAGMDVSRGGDEAQAADWFFRQKEVLIQGGSLRWTDEMRGAPPLALSDLRLVVRNGARSHAMRLDATPPPEWGGPFSLRGMFRQPLLSNHPGRWQDWHGQAFAEFDAVDLSQLRRHANLGVEVRSGRGALRAWVDLDHAKVVGGAADVLLSQVDAQLAPDRAPLVLASVSGRLAGKRLPHGFEFETHGLQFETGDGQRWPGGNLALSWQGAHDKAPEQGQLRADRLDLDALRRLADRLPLDEATRKMLATYAPKGLVDQLQSSWEGPPDQLHKYQVKARISGLEVASDPARRRPGVRGATLEVDLTQAGGKGRVQVERGAVDLPGLFDDPVLPLDRLSADLQWQHAGERTSLAATGIRLENADLQAEGQASWRTGDTPQARLPGVLDLQMTLPRAEGARVWRYLPVGVRPETREYVRQAVQAGRASDGKVRVRGDLRNFPFTDPRSGEFRISAKVRDAQFAFVPRRNGDTAAWAPLTGLSGELVFDRSSLRVNGAQGRFLGAPGLLVQADASIPQLDAAVVNVNGQVRGPLAESLAVFNASPVAQSLSAPLAQASGTGNAEVKLRLALPLAKIEQSKVQGSVAFSGNELQVATGVPVLSRVRGSVTFSERGFALVGVQARALGGDVRVDGGTRANAGAGEPHSLIRAQGTATAEGLRQARELGALARLARQASGSAAYAVSVGVRPAGVDLLVTSSLQGLALSLPPPLNKAAEAPLPLRFEIAGMPGARAQDQLKVELGRLASVTYVRDVSGPEPQVLRGAIGVGLAAGEAAALPEQGVSANINFASVNFDAWENLLDAAAGAPGVARPPARGASAGAAPAATASSVQSYLPNTLALRARELTVAGRSLHNVLVGGSREGRDGLTWRANIDAAQLNGYVEYRQPSGAGAGRLLARLSRLSLAASAAGEVEALLDEQPASIPALDVVVEDFELKGRKLGRMEIDAVNRGAAVGNAAEWRLNRLLLSNPDASFSANGNWAQVNAQGASAGARGGRDRRRTVMNFRLDVADGGQLLARLGMKDVIRRGHGRLEGQVAWVGSPMTLDYPSMNGNFAANIESGQFLKADPGLAKLLGVLSLQSLPRRLTLDFRDVFSEGFAFDFVRGDIAIAQGIASTNNLQMKGVNAAVLMEGRADIARETQDLKVVVVPEINAGTASLVASVINPAVGLGSFFAQLFLREPLIRANTQEFQIDGTWSDPRVTRVQRGAAPAASSPSSRN